MATTNAAVTNDGSITLDWASVTGANLYSIQVSIYPDFRVCLESDDAVATSQHAYSDTGTDDVKRYWRWRYSTNGGSSWSKWSEVGSFWIDSGVASEFVPGTNKLYLVNPDDPTDYIEFAVFPLFGVIPMSLNRAIERNRLGEMLSEYLTTKDKIVMEFDEDSYVQHEQYREIVRFHNVIKTFFIVMSAYNGRDYVTRIWKAKFTEDPEMSMVAAGRPDLMAGSLEAEEV